MGARRATLGYRNEEAMVSLLTTADRKAGESNNGCSHRITKDKRALLKAIPKHNESGSCLKSDWVE